MQAAFNRPLKRFRNFLGFNRQWLEDAGSDDCHGRALWALGTCVGRSRWPELPLWAASLFELALPSILETKSPRAWAHAIIGVQEYLRRFGGDRLAAQTRDTLATRLLELHANAASNDWPWFEHILSYDNARLPQALIAAARDNANPEMLEIGLHSLKWLTSIQTAPQGHFRPIGCYGFFPKNGERAQFDQQPIEAAATVSASLEAYRATGDAQWIIEARSAFEWFLGRNDLGLDLYDPGTGGCCDGLQEDRINRNQGAESTLAFLLSLAEMNLLEGSLAAFPDAR
jgi:hypothetical protein